MVKPYNIEKIRQEFPILARHIYGKRLAYLDNGASAQKPRVVLEAMEVFYTTAYANVHRGLHFLSNCATDAYEKARGTAQCFLGAEKKEQIVFCKNATEAINLVAYGWAMKHLHEGDEILLSIMEHHSNIVPWHFLRERLGVKLRFIPVDENGELHLDTVQNYLNERTKLLALCHMSNVLGTIPPVKEIITLAHQANIPVLLDGSQAAVHRVINVQDLDCEWYVFTGHKVYGPTGIGVLYGKTQYLEAMRPFQGGGEMIENVTVDNISYNKPPHRFESGTPPIAEAVGLDAALTYLMGQDRAALIAHEDALLAYAHDQLNQIKGLKIYGQSPSKGGIISFTMEGIHPHDIAVFLDRQGVAIRAGSHCAQPLLSQFSLTSTCRASLAMYNNGDDIDQLVDALQKAKVFFHD